MNTGSDSLSMFQVTGGPFPLGQERSKRVETEVRKPQKRTATEQAINYEGFVFNCKRGTGAVSIVA